MSAWRNKTQPKQTLENTPPQYVLRGTKLSTGQVSAVSGAMLNPCRVKFSAPIKNNKRRARAT